MKHPSVRAGLVIALGLVICGGVLGCQPGANDSAPPATYVAQGEIRRLPERAEAGAELWIRHGEIPDFVDVNGERVGMEAMTMPFPIAEGHLVDGLAVGDRVEFQFEVRWEGSPPLELTRVDKLPPSP